MSDKKPTIRIHFADQWKGYPASNNEVITILSKEYEIVFDTESPDILFYSSFGWEHIYYNDPLKVFWSPENVYPDFNDCNYALSHLRDRISGRNIWYPYWLKAIEPSFWYQSWLGEQNPEDIEQLFPLPKDPEKRPFASFIASSSELYGARYREEFVKYLMEKYKHVDCPGKILHNIEIPELEPRDGSWLPSKRSYIGRYKFNIAFENSNTDGYITEKLVDCFMANTVPIYWGSEGNIDPFPREAVICANDYTDFDSLLARIREVDENDDLYLAMLRANPVHRAEFMSEVQKHCDEVRKFIRYIAQEALNRKKSDGCYRRRSVGNADNIVCYIVKKEKNRIIKATIFNFIKLPAKMIKSYLKKLFYVFFTLFELKMNTFTCHDYKTSHRCLWIDAARGIAILLVLLAHSQYWTFCVTNLEHRSLFYIATVMGLLQASYMPLFYVLSGYTFKEHPNLLKQRFKRLIYPYMLWGGISLTCILLFLSDTSTTDFLKAVGGLIYSRYTLLPLGSEENIKLLPICSSPLWFLTSLYTSYVLFSLIIKLRNYRFLLIGGYIVATILLSRLPILLPWSLDVAPAGALFIYTGYAMKCHNILSYPLRWLLVSAVPTLILYCILVRYNGQINMSVREYGYHLCSPMLFLIIGVLGSMLYCILCIVFEKNKITSLLACLGRNSLTILCSHMFVYAFISVISTQYASIPNVFHALIQYRFAIEIVLAIMLTFSLTSGSKRLRLFLNWKADKKQLR